MQVRCNRGTYACAALAASASAILSPAVGVCQGAPADPFLLGAAFARSDLSALGPGVTTLEFVPGKGLVRDGAMGPAPPVVQAPPPTVAEAPAARQAAEMDLIPLPKISTATRLKDMLGVGDGGKFGGRPRYFLFAAIRGRAIGYNFMQGREGGPTNRLALDRGGFLGREQVGLAWRGGDTQVSLSYIYDRIDVRIFDVGDVSEQRLAFTLSRFSGDPTTSPARPFAHKSALAPPAN